MAVSQLTPTDALALLDKELSANQLQSIIQQVLMLNTDNEDSKQLRLKLANLARQNGLLGQAAALHRALATLWPDEHIHKLAEAECLIYARQAEVALRALAMLPDDVKEDSTALELYGRAFEQVDREEEAVEAYKKIVKTGRLKSSVAYYLTNLLISLDRAREAESILTRLLENHPDKGTLWNLLASVKLRTDRPAEALVAVRKALSLDPDNQTFAFSCATILQTLGQLSEAESVIESALKTDPRNATLLALFSTVHKYKFGTPEWTRLEVALSDVAEKPDRNQSVLLHSKAKALEDADDVEAALAFYTAAGRIVKRERPFNPAEEGGLFRSYKRVFTHEFATKRDKNPELSRSPIFVLGMPRSGTSLLEQVLSSHSQIAGIGEQRILMRACHGIVLDERLKLDFSTVHAYYKKDDDVSFAERGRRYLAEAAKIVGRGVPHTVDKMPPNYRHIGLIDRILPNATVIHSMRHPVETCMSCFKVPFSEGHAWSYDLADLATHYRTYYEIMSFWESTFPGKVLHVRYEDTVDDLEWQARRILAKIGLDFEDACLNFQNNKNPMRTASVLQVRQPIYRTSLDKWQKHRDLLKHLYDGIGDIIEMYEKREGLYALGGQNVA